MMIKFLLFLGLAITCAAPVFLNVWGRRLRKNPPEFGKGRMSFRTKFAKQNEDVWNFSNALFSHIIAVCGINLGLISIVFYVGALALSGVTYWAAAAFSLFAAQLICIFLVFLITNSLAKKMYSAGEGEKTDESAEPNNEVDQSGGDAPAGENEPLNTATTGEGEEQ